MRACVIPSECPTGMFGFGCRQQCQCENNAFCDHVSGACTCQQGWTGTYCEKREKITLIGNQNSCLLSCHRVDKYMFNMFLPVSGCPWGFYGLDCQEKCLCLNGGSCNHISGECSCPAGWIGPFCNLSELQLHHTKLPNDEMPPQCHGPDHSSDTFDQQSSCRGNDIVVPLLAACPSGSYGEGCNQTCSCRNAGICHPASGQCACASGWTGPSCTEGG